MNIIQRIFLHGTHPVKFAGPGLSLLYEPQTTTGSKQFNPQYVHKSLHKPEICQLKPKPVNINIHTNQQLTEVIRDLPDSLAAQESRFFEIIFVKKAERQERLNTVEWQKDLKHIVGKTRDPRQAGSLIAGQRRIIY
ncbi:hypothetical protein HA49_18360 [Tatumella morbirosei]|uniref:Uncharacterized protein n=1 Tax=Tatumella morbirosei TaxID=642227 RepID=A0A095T1P7_9GAMM|nr:hypothetical protein [Tatumella morbirosei]KGD70871.1 hypothetical protein HA49_18360 [Tatumella morbirosei]